MTGSWVERGACYTLRKTVGGEREALRVFYPNPDQLSLRFRLVCDVCRVRCECLEWGLLVEDWGGWGGTDEEERREMREGIADGFTSLADILRARDCVAAADRIDDEQLAAEAITPTEAAAIASEALSEHSRPVSSRVQADSPPMRRPAPPVPPVREQRRRSERPSLVERLFGDD